MSTDNMTVTTIGESFAAALAAQDKDAMRALLADSIDFHALTPGRCWQAVTPRQVVDDIVLGTWFGPGKEITELRSVTGGQVGDRSSLAYQLLVRYEDVSYLVEQQAYYNASDTQITWLRVLCSGYQPISGDQAVS
jgi:hypothetical protein